MIGMAGEYPPTDDAGFLEYARSLPTKEIYYLLKNAKPVTPIIGYRRAENRLHHFHELPCYLEGFVAMGDSVYALNPVYGQGMTVASITSTVLDDCLRERSGQKDLSGFSSNFQRCVAKVISGPWQLATNEDFRWIPNATIDFPTRMIQKYMEQVLRAMMVDTEVAEAFVKVQNMMEDPTSLMKPRIIARVLRVALYRRGKQERPVPASV